MAILGICEPFLWEDPPGRRAQIRAELDAYYARLYGLTRDELCHILDPKEVHGEDFPGETFRVLKEKEVTQFGNALRRTRRLANAASGGVGWVGWIVKDGSATFGNPTKRIQNYVYCSRS